MSAERIALAMRGDPQFRAPRLPRLVDGLVVVRLRDGVLIEGAAERQHLRGAASVSLLPRLLALLDGERDVAALGAALGEQPAKVGKAIALLYACGLLEEGSESDLPPAGTVGSDSELTTFISRHVDTTRVNANTSEAVQRMADAFVAVVGPAATTDAIVAELRRTAIGSVEPVESLPADASAFTLAVGVDTGDRYALACLDRDCAAAGIPWVRYAQTESAIEIGPRFERFVSLCYTCFATLHSLEQPVAPGTGDPAAFDLLLAHAVADVTWLVARVCTALSPGGVTRIAMADLTHERRAYAAIPGCDECGTGAPLSIPGVPVAYAYDRSVAFPPRHLLNVKDHQHHFRESNLALQSEAKSYPSALAFELPRPEVEAPPAGVFDGGLPHADAPGRLDLSTLAALLARTAGLRGDDQGFGPIPGKLPRWAPSGGNLGSVELYVLVRELPGLESGIWFYAPQARKLQRLAPQRGSAEVALLLQRASVGALHPDTSVALVQTGALVRVARKYGTFAYRTVHLDAGAALGQLHAVCTGAGLRAESASSWDDQALRAALGLTEFEPITAVVGLRAAEGGGLRPVGSPASPRPAAAPTDALLLSGAEFEPTQIYRRLLRQTALAAPLGDVHETGPAPWPQEGPVARLERAGDARTPIEAILRRRRSIRAYDPRPLDSADLAVALRGAWHSPTDSDTRAAIEIAVLSRRVSGLDEGLWSLEGADPIRLVRRNGLPAAEDAENIVLQREYGHAPVLVLVLGSLRTTDARAGAHGYRLLLRAATAIAQATWLAALSVGVDGSIFAGLLPDAVERLCGGGPYDRAQLIGLALGYAPGDAEGS
jgi:SagB-type dehydrogenase family enzyme